MVILVFHLAGKVTHGGAVKSYVIHVKLVRFYVFVELIQQKNKTFFFLVCGCNT